MSKIRVFIASLFLGAGLAAADPVLSILPDHSNGIYQVGESVQWKVDVTGDRRGLDAVPYVVLRNCAGAVASGTLDLSHGSATITASLDAPGGLLAEVFAPGSDTKKRLGLGGAFVAPDQVKLDAEKPSDFDDFWKDKLAELAQIPPNPVLGKVDFKDQPDASGVDYYKVTLDNIGGTHVRGQLARPSGEGKYPALLMLQYAGVYPLDRHQVINAARSGWLALDIEAHDIEIDGADAYYQQLKNGPLRGYAQLGCDDRDHSYFLRMFLGCVQAAHYLASRDDWDGKILVATGDSQGGLQTFATAALDPQITAIITMVPAGFDNYAPLAHPPRGAGWPNWLTWSGDKEKIKATAGYFDGAFFASEVHCPALVAVALLDETAIPSSVIGGYNAIPGRKELIVMPLSEHHGSIGGSGFHQAVAKWKAALAKGESPPLSGGGLSSP